MTFFTNATLSFAGSSLLLLISSLALSACVPEPGEGNFAEQKLTPIVKRPGSSKPASSNDQNVKLGTGQGIHKLDGTWLLGYLNSSCVLTNTEQIGVAYQLIHIKQDGNVLKETREACGFDLSAVLGLKPVIPSNGVRAVKVNIDGTGFVTRAEKNGGYASPTVIATLGLNLTNPLTDPLNTLAAVDSDKDGHPGMTIEMSGTNCERYVVQRQIVRFLGTLETPNMIKGKTTDRTEVKVLGGGPLCSVETELRPNDAFSEFVMARVDGQGGSTNADGNGDGKITCEEVEYLFPSIIKIREPNDENCK